jgi:hypothetical protein
MKFKLDECMDVRLVRLFADAGHASQTVYVEGLSGEAEHLVHMVIMKLVEEDPKGRLWVVDRRGIRIWPAG